MDNQDSQQNQPGPQESINQPQPVVGGSPGTSQVAQPSAPMQPTKKSKKVLIVGLIIAFLLIAGGAAAAAYYMYVNNKPEKVLADALTNTLSDLVEKKPASSVGALTFESQGDNPLKLTVRFEGASSGENGEGSADVTVNFSGKTYNIKASAVVFGESEFYFKVENLQETITTLMGSQPEFAAYGESFEPIISKIDNRWIRVTQEDLKEFGMPDEEKVDKCTAALQNLTLSSGDKKQLKKLFQENQFIVAGETFKNETVANENSFHYKLDFNNQAAENFAKQVIALQSFESVKNDCELDEKKIEEGFKQDGSSNKDKVKPVVELWVGKKSRRPTKFRVSANDKDFTVDFNTEFKLNAENISIEKPSSSVSVDELKSEFEKLVPSSSQNMSGFDSL